MEVINTDCVRIWNQVNPRDVYNRETQTHFLGQRAVRCHGN